MGSQLYMESIILYWKIYFANITFSALFRNLHLIECNLLYTYFENKINTMSMQDPHLSNVMLITCIMLVIIPLSPHYSHPCFTPGPWSSMKLSRDCGTCPWYVRLYVFTALAAIHFKLSFVCVRRMISATPAMQSKKKVFIPLKIY